MSASTTLENAAKAPATSVRLAPLDFERLSKLIYDTCGIELKASKQQMVESRLQRRLRETGAGTFPAYWKLLCQDQTGKEEMINLIDTITTNKTDFFREPVHFEYLKNKVVPDLGKKAKADYRPFRLWSAGCSTGKEPYTLAMILSNCKRDGSLGEFSILGTDIDTQVLKHASRAIYPESDLEPIPIAFRSQYLLKSRRRDSPSFRLVPEIRALVKFARLNFMDPKYSLEEPFDVIFCRNVMIYFDKRTQETLVNKFHQWLRPGGYLFIGHSETLNGLQTPLVGVAPTIYQRA